MERVSSETHSPSKGADTSVLVLLAACNGEKYITEQISSILGQTKVRVRVVISVDLSSDYTYELCVGMAKKDRRVSVLPYGDRFGSAARNFYRLISDCELGDSTLVAFSDQDDIWEADKLNRAASVCRSEGAECYLSSMKLIWENGKTGFLSKTSDLCKFDYLFHSGGAGCTYVICTRLLLELKDALRRFPHLFSPIDSYDWLIYAFSRAGGYRWFKDEKSFIFYRQHSYNTFGARAGITSYVKRFKLLCSGWYIKEVRCISSVVKELIGIEPPPMLWILKNILRLRPNPMISVLVGVVCIFNMPLLKSDE